MPTEIEPTKYEQIIDLLATEGPLSTYQITRKLGINGTGQTINRLRILEIRGRVKRVPGRREGESKWSLTGA